MSKRIDWIYDPTAHRKHKTEAEKMNEAVDLATLASDALASDALAAPEEEEEVSGEMLAKIKEDPLFAIRRTQLRKDERRRSRSPRREISQDRHNRLRDLLKKKK